MTSARTLPGSIGTSGQQGDFNQDGEAMMTMMDPVANSSHYLQRGLVALQTYRNHSLHPSAIPTPYTPVFWQCTYCERRSKSAPLFGRLDEYRVGAWDRIGEHLRVGHNSGNFSQEWLVSYWEILSRFSGIQHRCRLAHLPSLSASWCV